MNAPDKNGAPMRGEQSKPSAQGGERVDKGAAFKAFCEFHGFRHTERELTFFDAGFMAATPPATSGNQDSLAGDAEPVKVIDSDTYCRACGGEGTISTGLIESPTTQCSRCDGTGLRAGKKG